MYLCPNKENYTHFFVQGMHYQYHTLIRAAPIVTSIGLGAQSKSENNLLRPQDQSYHYKLDSLQEEDFDIVMDLAREREQVFNTIQQSKTCHSIKKKNLLFQNTL